MFENFVTPESVVFELHGTERDEILAELTEILIKKDRSLNREEVFSALVEREEKKSTLVHEYLAVPHGVLENLKDPVVALGLSKRGVEFNLETVTPEESLAKVVFCILFPKDKANLHLVILKDILSLVQKPGFMNELLQAQDENEICDLIKRAGV